MGGGSYSVSNSTARSTAMYAGRSSHQIFESRSMNNEMNPANTLRECCDSEEHPNTIPIIIGLDVTGSMGYVPTQFIKEGMTTMMADLYKAGMVDAQVLFMGIGDHECDRSPLQVGQFEADDQLLDKWLKNVYLESGGGGNGGESYLLAWKYAASNTRIDSFEKRGTKGFLFTIGDEPNLRTLPRRAQSEIFGSNGQYLEESDASLLEQAQESYNVFHIHTRETGRGRSLDSRWREVLGDNLLIVENHTEIPTLIANTVGQAGYEPTLVDASAPLTEGVDTTEEML